MANERNSIDELFRNGLKDGGITPPPGVWEAVSAGVSVSVAPSLGIVIVKSVWTWVTLAVIGTGAVLSVLSNSKNEAPVITEKTTQKQAQEEGKVTDRKIEVNTPLTEAVNKQNTEGKPTRQILGNSENNNAIVIAGFVSAGENTGHTNQTNQLQPPTEKQSDKLVVQDHSTVVTTPCGRNLKITPLQSGSDNNWTFAAAGISSGTYSSWMFGDGETGSGNPVQHTYTDLNAEYEVKVLVFRSAGCIDSGICRVVTRQRHAGLSIPDVFTPNGDNLNDELVITLPEVAMFNQVVTDRNGKQVFVSNSTAIRWTGKCASLECPAGTYRVTITYKTPAAKQAVTYIKNVLLNR